MEMDWFIHSGDIFQLTIMSLWRSPTRQCRQCTTAMTANGNMKTCTSMAGNNKIYQNILNYKLPLIFLHLTITDNLTRPVCHNLFKPQQISFDTWFWCCWPSCWPSPLSSSQASVWAELQMDGNGNLQMDINLTWLTSKVSGKSPKKARQNFYSLIIRNSQWPKCYLMIHLVCTAFWRYF